MLDTIYTILIAAGIVLPLLSLLFGGVDALLGGVDLDLDGDGNAGFLSFNFNALLSSLVVVGCIGKLCLSSFHLWPVSLVAGLICGAAAYILICKFLILPLKRNNAKAMRAEDALFQHVNVIETIPEGGTGQVELTDAAGSRITYLAKYQFADFEPRGPIQAGTVVKVLDTENNLLVVGRLF